MQSGLVFNVQRFSLQDGPGVRTTVFLKGCPLACRWCHNPESQSPEPIVVRMKHRCMTCGSCSSAAMESLPPQDPEGVEACPTGALQAIGTRITSSDLAQQLMRDRIFFDESGGGVTFSGGEPLAQAAFVIETLAHLRREGIRSALDTCGFARWEDLQAAAESADLVLYDLKLMDEERHRAATGVSNRTILANLERLAQGPREIWIRVPIIPGLNDDRENIEATADFLARIGGIRKVDLLPYHATGEAKFARAGMDYSLHDTPTPGIEHLEALACLFRARNIPTDIGGHP